MGLLITPPIRHVFDIAASRTDKVIKEFSKVCRAAESWPIRLAVLVKEPFFMLPPPSIAAEDFAMSLAKMTANDRAKPYDVEGMGVYQKWIYNENMRGQSDAPSSPWPDIVTRVPLNHVYDTRGRNYPHTLSLSPLHKKEAKLTIAYSLKSPLGTHSCEWDIIVELRRSKQPEYDSIDGMIAARRAEPEAKENTFTLNASNVVAKTPAYQTFVKRMSHLQNGR